MNFDFSNCNKIERSKRKDKRFKITINGTSYHFGSKDGVTFIDGANLQTKKNWITRHKNIKNIDLKIF